MPRHLISDVYQSCLVSRVRPLTSAWPRWCTVTINNNTGLYESGNWNEYNLNPLTRIHWRSVRLTVSTSLLVPTAGDALLALIGQDFDPIVLAFGIGVMINRDSRGQSYFIVRDTVLVSTINDADQGSADVTFRTPPAPYEKLKSLGSGGSMVARLKLKGIDGRAPPGVEPAA
ncbi:hypothetical protein GOBAR_DD16791 [Gossypium barbadense]|nr:hypothetical protein GOBAR_DD16791 [Gossypium barbadense]